MSNKLNRDSAQERRAYLHGYDAKTEINLSALFKRTLFCQLSGLYPVERAKCMLSL